MENMDKLVRLVANLIVPQIAPKSAHWAAAQMCILREHDTPRKEFISNLVWHDIINSLLGEMHIKDKPLEDVVDIVASLLRMQYNMDHKTTLQEYIDCPNRYSLVGLMNTYNVDINLVYSWVILTYLQSIVHGFSKELVLVDGKVALPFFETQDLLQIINIYQEILSANS